MRRWRWFVVAAVALGIPVASSPPAPAADQAVAERIDTGHTGFASGRRLGRPPLQQRWAIELGTGMTYPLIAGGRVFVTFRDPIRSSDMLAALDAATGNVAWARPIGRGARLAYENGRVFALDAAGVATAVDAASGATLWVRFVFEPFDATGPVARNGLLYMFLAWSGGSLYALNQSDGTTRWRAGATYDGGTPAVDGRYVYVTDGYDCATSASDALTGVTVWAKAFDCWYPGGEWTATNGAHVVTSAKQILDAGSGLLWDEGFGGKAALAGALVLQLNGRVLQARDLRTGVLVWEFYGDGRLGSAPVVVNHTVYIGSGSGLLYALDLASGAQRWSATLPFVCEYSCEYDAVGSAGMAAGEGLLVVPAGGILYALESPAAPAAGLDLQITSGPDAPIAGRSASFAFAAAGEHTFAVRAIDQAGNADPSPASASWTTAAPAPPGGGDPGAQPPAPEPLAPTPLLPIPTPTPGLAAVGTSSTPPSAPVSRTPAALARAIRSQLAAGRSSVSARFKPRTIGRLTVEVLARRSVRVARTRVAFDRPVEREVRVRLARTNRPLKVRVTWVARGRRTVSETRYTGSVQTSAIDGS